MLRVLDSGRTGLIAVVSVLLSAGLVLQSAHTAQATDSPPDPNASQTDGTSPDDVVGPGSGDPKPTAVGDALSTYTATSRPVNVRANDLCPVETDADPANGSCTIVNLSGPPGWRLATDNTNVWVAIPGDTRSGVQNVTYQLQSGDGKTMSDPATIQVSYTPQPTPDNYYPAPGSRFSHAFTGSNDTIRSHTLRTINSVPAGSTIRILSWSFRSRAYRNALFNAKNRGVNVQIIVAERNTGDNSDWPVLASMFGTNRNASSFAYKCRSSCRGGGGTMHAKIFIFSQVRDTQWVTMTGSGNMTDFAATGQWNQQVTNVEDKAAYDLATRVFLEARVDVPQPSRYIAAWAGPSVFYYTPLGSASPRGDFMWQTFRQTACYGPGGRTTIRIAMYVWREARGMWLAKEVRRLWNAGCNVQVIYAIMANRVKKVLYSPRGRGRIPMRQVLMVNSRREPLWYLHNKYVAMTGTIGGQAQSVVYQGSFNFSNLGMYSDENFQAIYGRDKFDRYATDFAQVWRQRQSRAPSPISSVKNLERLGTGRYQYMDVG